MPQALTTSPFANQEETALPWIVWEKCDNVNTLNARTTEEPVPISTAAARPGCDASAKGCSGHEMQISRLQYQSVLNRINQAQRRTGSYSAWQS